MPVKQVSLTSRMPVNLREKELEHLRSQEIARALLEQSLRPEDRWTIDSGKYIVPDIGKAIGKVGQAWIGRSAQKEADAGLAELNRLAEAQYQQDNTKYLNAKFGGQDLGNAPPEGQMGPPTVDQTVSKADPIAAIRAAMASQDPRMQALAAKDMEKLPDPTTLLKAAEHLSPEGLAQYQQTLDPRVLAGRQRGTIQDGILATTQDGRLVGKTPVQQYGPPTIDPTTQLPMAIEQTTNEPKALTGGNVTPDRASGREFGKQMGEIVANDLKSTYTALQQGKNNLPLVMQIPDLIRGAQTGMGAEWILQARRFGEMLGVKGENLDKINDSQSFVNAVGPQVVAMLKQFGSSNSLTDADREAAKQYMLSGLGNSPEAMLRAQALVFAGIMNTMKMHDENLARASQVEEFPKGAIDYMKVDVKLPGDAFDKMGVTFNESLNRYEANTVPKGGLKAAGVPTDYSTMSDDDIRKRLKGGR